MKIFRLTNQLLCRPTSFLSKSSNFGQFRFKISNGYRYLGKCSTLISSNRQFIWGSTGAFLPSPFRRYYSISVEERERLIKQMQKHVEEQKKTGQQYDPSQLPFDPKVVAEEIEQLYMSHLAEQTKKLGILTDEQLQTKEREIKQLPEMEKRLNGNVRNELKIGGDLHQILGRNGASGRWLFDERKSSRS